jgi:predicted methyltransferase
VFATESIEVGTTIEISPVLVVTPTERAELEKTVLYDYIFEWGDDLLSACVALGYLSIYNHSYAANCVYEMDFDNATISITTVKPVAAGDELFINYNAEPDNTKPIWFEAT